MLSYNFPLCSRQGCG